MGNMIKTVAVLTVLCGLAGFILSSLKNVTAPAIEQQVLVNVQGPAIASVFTSAANNPVDERRHFTTASGADVAVFPCIVDGKLTGVALEDFGKGYGGSVGVIVGFNLANDTLAGIGTTVLKETPGLGMRAREPFFTKQFKGAALPVALSSKGGKVDAISGATITSSGVVEAVNKAAEVYKELKPQIVEQWGK